MDADFSGNAMLALEEQKKVTKSCVQMELPISLMKQAKLNRKTANFEKSV
jgi:hypothetical protein